MTFVLVSLLKCILYPVCQHILMHIHYVSRGRHGYVDQLKKLPSKWCIPKDVLTYSLGNREETDAQLQV